MNRPVFLMVLFCFCLATPAFSSQGEDNWDYSYGEVIKATATDLEVLEYDYETDKEQTVHYSVNAGTTLTNVRQAAQLARGDTVEVYFQDVNGARVAQTIIKDDGPVPADDDQDSSEEIASQ
jgi:hypothetical protein